MAQFAEQLAAAEKYPKNFTALNSLLKFIRKEKVRRPDLVVKYGKTLLESYPGRLTEVWSMYEQVFVAALDVGDSAVSKFCFQKLKEKFPDSTRVQRLEGMAYEAQGDYKRAEVVYMAVLEANPANALVSKRLVCLLKAQGKIPEAITKLNEYLAKFQTDSAAWQELADLYISISNYRSAAFCYEELILANPLDFHYHCRLAEIYFTIGGLDKLKMARKHFAASVELNSINNTRAYLGLMMTAHAISSSKGSKAEKDDIDINSRIYSFAADKFGEMYRSKANEEVTDIVLETFQSQIDMMKAN